MSHRWKRSQKPSRLTPEAWGSRKPQKLRENQIPKSSEKSPDHNPKHPTPLRKSFFSTSYRWKKKKLETLEIPGRGKPFGKPDPRGKKKRSPNVCVCVLFLGGPCLPVSQAPTYSFPWVTVNQWKGSEKKKTRPNLAPAFPAPLQPQVSGFAPLASTWPHQPNNFEIDGKDNTLSFSLVQKMQRVMLMKRFVHRPQNTWISQLSHIVFYGQLITKSAIKSFNKHKATQWHDQIS